jgi:hypothetical protein
MAINSTYKKIPGREFYHSYREAILSAFILLNLSTVLFMNRPIWLIRDVNRAMQRHLSPMLSYRFTYLSWLMQSPLGSASITAGKCLADYQGSIGGF